ncbi:MAG: HpsJ family protein [Thermosynechococcaceae cyanobacterium]
MTNYDKRLTQKVDLLINTNSSLWTSVRLLNWIGYGFLIFALFDVIATIVPPNFTNPVWEFSFVGNLVERVAAPLIGFGLVFLGGQVRRPKWERLILKILSWLALLIGLLYLLLIGLGVSSTVRIDRDNNQQITVRARQTKTQLEQVQSEFQAANTVEKMETLLGRLDSQGRAPEIANDEQFQTAKEQFGKFIDQGQKRLSGQVETTRKTQRLGLLKNSLKWNLGALLSSALFISIWRGTADIRRK